MAAPVPSSVRRACAPGGWARRATENVTKPNRRRVPPALRRSLGSPSIRPTRRAASRVLRPRPLQASMREFGRKAAEEEEEDGSSSIYNLDVGKSLSFIEQTSVEPGLKIGKSRRSIIWDKKEIRQAEAQGLQDTGPLTKLAYKYYNWRTGTENDITVFLSIAAAAMTMIGLGNQAIRELYGDHESFWDAFYQVLTLSFGDGFPDADEAGLARLYAIVVASVGLVFFTILLAMVEQLFMEVLESQVKQGSQVCEEGHMLILTWVTSALSLSATFEVMRQACNAYRREGGVTIVVLCDKPKMEMEAIANKTLPLSERHGSKLVFREGSPLNPGHLEVVAAHEAGSTVVLSDASRSATEADAQCLRAAVLIDDMFDSGEGRGNVVVELKTGHFARMMRHVSSGHVIPVPTYNMQSIRLARMVKRPISSLITETTMDFSSGAQYHIHEFPELIGVNFSDLKYYFPTATVMGIINISNRICNFNPQDHMVEQGDELILIRGGDCSHSGFRCPQEPCSPAHTSIFASVEEDASNSYEDIDAFMHEITQDLRDRLDRQDSSSTEWRTVSDAMETVVDRGFATNRADDDDSEDAKGFTAAADSVQALTSISREVIQERKQREQEAEAPRVLIIGWLEDKFMAETIQEMDHGLARLRLGAEVVLFNNRGKNPGANGRTRSMSELFGPLERLKLTYIQGDPLDNIQLESLPLETFNCIIIVCDQSWMDPDMDSTNGIETTCTADMTRLDSMVMAVQVNVRLLLDQVEAGKKVKIITEKVAFEGLTRFEDPLKLPLGVSINRKDFVAKLIAYASYTPKIIPVMSAMAQTTNIELRDAGLFVEQGEQLSYWSLMERVAEVKEILLGWVELPPSAKREMKVILNPEGDKARSEVRHWRSKRIKLITMSRRRYGLPAQTAARLKRLQARRQRRRQHTLKECLISGSENGQELRAAYGLRSNIQHVERKEGGRHNGTTEILR